MKKYYIATGLLLWLGTSFCQKSLLYTETNSYGKTEILGEVKRNNKNANKIEVKIFEKFDGEVTEKGYFYEISIQELYGEKVYTIFKETPATDTYESKGDYLYSYNSKNRSLNEQVVSGIVTRFRVQSRQINNIDEGNSLYLKIAALVETQFYFQVVARDYSIYDWKYENQIDMIDVSYNFLKSNSLLGDNWKFDTWKKELPNTYKHFQKYQRVKVLGEATSAYDYVVYKSFQHLKIEPNKKGTIIGFLTEGGKITDAQIEWDEQDWTEIGTNKIVHLEKFTYGINYKYITPIYNFSMLANSGVETAVAYFESNGYELSDDIGSQGDCILIEHRVPLINVVVVEKILYRKNNGQPFETAKEIAEIEIGKENVTNTIDATLTKTYGDFDALSNYNIYKSSSGYFLNSDIKSSSCHLFLRPRIGGYYYQCTLLRFKKK